MKVPPSRDAVSLQVDDDDFDDDLPPKQPVEEKRSYRPVLLCSLGVALLIFLASAAIHYRPTRPFIVKDPAAAAAISQPSLPRSPLMKKQASSSTAPRGSKQRPKTKDGKLRIMSEKALEEKRLNDLKTAEIRAAQEDPNSAWQTMSLRAVPSNAH